MKITYHKTYYNEQQVHETISLVVGDDGMVADEVVACLKQNSKNRRYNDHIESQIDGYIQSEIDKQRGK